MKITVNSRHPKEMLIKADEIRVSEKDINIILNFIEDFPEKPIIYTAPPVLDYEDTHFWNTLDMYNDKLDNFMVEIQDGRQFFPFSIRGLKVFWKYPINTYYDLRAVVAQNPCYINLGEPLCFELAQVKKITKDIPLRMTVNYAYDPYISRHNGLHGKWMRPEDTEVYEKYIDAIDFRTEKLSEETMLFNTYKKAEWPGNLNLLIKNLGINMDNRAIPDGFAERRMNCGQICEKTGNCHYCENTVKFNKIIRDLHDKNKQKDNI